MRSPATSSTGSRAPRDVFGGVSGALAKITAEYSIIGWMRLSGNMRSPAPVRIWSDMENRRWPWLSRGERTNIYPKSKVAVMTLLRTVGYVLKDVDRPATDRATRWRIDAEWERLKRATRPHIFWDFIDDERGRIVHLYDPSARVNVTIGLGGVSTGGGGNPAGPAREDFVMWKGPFEGRDPRELCREAMVFWRDYLDAIDEPH